ncbi:MAG TPA: ribosome maturation factor RimP [Candidatus Eisenbacteria bacterium]|nr:ribosome maturation factor RimP [Candidatus Eisenbacteria bacterium]
MHNDLKEELAARFRELLEEEAFTLWDLEVAGQSGRTVLRVYVDRQPGVTLDECAYWSRKLARWLEEANLLRGAYVLEVGSPGIERALTRPEHYARFVGSRVEVRLHDPKEGRRTFRGELRAAGESSIVVEDPEAGTVSIPLASVRRSHVVADPWEGMREPKRKHDRKA